MTDNQITEKIRKDLRAAFPLTVFQVTFADGDLTLLRVGGSDYKDKYPTQAGAVAAVEKAVQKTIPGFRFTDYD